MALAIDASSPAVVLNPTGNGVASVTTTTTAAFSPPAGSLLLLVASIDVATGNTPTLAVSGGTGLTWTQVLSQNAAAGSGGRSVIWTAPNNSAQSNIQITLTGTGTGSPYSLAMKLYVLTGADTTTPVATSLGATMSIAGNGTKQQSLTNGTRANGLLFSVYTDYQAATQTAPTSSDLTVDAAGTLGGTSLDINYGFGHRTATAASTAYTATWADNTSGGAAGSVAAVIIQPSAATDTTAPTVPTNVAATANSATSVTVSWTASTDAVGVSSYRIMRGGVALTGADTVAGTSFIDTTVSASTAYSYTVSAVDAAGNRSAESTAANVTTPAAADTTAPTVPTGVTATANSATSVTVSWTASTDAVGVASYRIRRGGSDLTGATAVSGTTFTDTTAAASTAYSYTVSAVDAAGNRSAESTAANVTTPAAAANYSIYGTNSPGTLSKANDGSGLSVATAFYTNANNGNGIDVSTWRAIGARFYLPAGVTIASPQMNLWANPDLSATPLATVLMGTLTAGQWNEVLFSSPVTLTPNTYYWIGYHTGSGSSDYLAMASPTNSGIPNATNTLFFADTAETGSQRTSYRYDNGSAGRNNSLFGADVLVAPASTGADTTAPTVPTNVTAVANSANSVTVSWTASTDAVGVASYQVKRGGTIIANAVTTGTSYQDTTAAASTTYTYTVNAVDAAGNRSADSTGAGVTTPAGSGPWVRKSIIKNAGSGSTTQTINFTAATAGNLLVAICGGSVTFTTPTGWTLPATGSAVNASGLYLFYKTATAGESSFTTTNNGSNYPVGAIVYEFAAGSTVAQVVSASGVHTGTANPALTGLTGTNSLFGVGNQGISVSTSGTCTWSGVTGLVADVDQFQAPVSGTGGYELSTTYIANSTLTSFAPVPAFTASGDTAGNSERLTFAISPNNPNNPTLVNGVARPVVNGGTVGLDISATPPSGQTITGHSWVITNGNGTLTNATTATPTYTAPASGSGIATVTDTVTASGGGSSTATVFVSYGPNIVAAENAISGDARSTWDLANGNFGGLATLQGFADGFSFDKTQTVNFKIAQSDGAGWTADVYRMGYYGGNGGRVIASGLTPTGTQLTNSQAQPAPADADATTTLLSADCSAWATTMTWTPPSWAPSGVYILKLNRTGGGISHVIFMLRDDSRVADLLVMTADHTWNAYNAFGGMGSNQYTGNSLYYGTSVSQANADRAKFVSYDRPFVNRGAADTSRTYGAVAYSTFFSSEYTMVRFLERNGYDVKYYAGIDAAGDAAGSKIIGKCTAAMMVGHNEYWSNNMRAGWEAAKAAGINIFVCASNEVFWRTVASTTDASGRPRVVECYKTTIDGQGSTRPQWTGTWRDPNGAGKGGSNPEISLTGTIFAVNGPDLRALTVPFAYASSKLWRGTSVASLTSGQTFTSPPQILGFEWDAWGPAGVNTTGATYMGTVNAQANYASSSTYSPSQVLTDAGGAYATGTVEHRLAITPGVNGSVVFGTGTCQWSWGLDNANTYQGTGSDNTSIVIQQATVNMLTDMNVTPKTVMNGLTVPSKYTWYSGSANLTHLGAGDVTLYLGGNAVNAVYIGSTKVYP